MNFILIFDTDIKNSKNDYFKEKIGSISIKKHSNVPVSYKSFLIANIFANNLHFANRSSRKSSDLAYFKVFILFSLIFLYFFILGMCRIWILDLDLKLGPCQFGCLS